MIDLKNLHRAIEQLVKEKGIDASLVLGAVESAIAAAYRKEYGKRGEIIKAKIDGKTGQVRFWKVKTVVDDSTVRLKEDGVTPTSVDAAQTNAEKSGPRESAYSPRLRSASDGQARESALDEAPVYNPDRHIFMDEAVKIKEDAALGDELEFSLPEYDDFGRIASQAAKQVILQRLREVERESVEKEYKGKEGEIVSGIVQRVERGNVYIDLGRAAGIMFYSESIPGEHYRIGERLRFYLIAVQEESRLPGVILSRSHPRFVSKLFELEVPEIQEGLVEVKTIAREPGSRTKIAVSSNAQGVDPVGALVGQRGTRVMAVTNELGNEKIDIIEWSDDPVKFIGQALSPARVREVEVLPRRTALVLVPEDQLSLAIGRGGQNARLAAKLTGWKIDVRSASRPEIQQEGGVAQTEEKSSEDVVSGEEGGAA
ncbi:transcription termination/antitermination protein NusA [Candidatus Wolfebacteria bacterium]|nr:transcription termination/antitermination protein NusA [Candidatus Wolfebacteria bacterium]